MELNLTPVKVDIVTEIPTTTKDAFYNLCFIADNNEAPRTIEITQLDDLLSNGYKVTDSAYDFCNSVFLQNGIDKVYIRAKRSGETYEEAFDADDNSTYYYCVIQSKDISVVLKFNDYINTVDQFKLQFFSSKDDVSELIKNRKIVFYFDETNPSEKHTIYASRLYPYFFSESVTNSAIIQGLGSILSSPTDSITVNNATMSGSGELRSAYNLLNNGFDAITVNNATMSGSGDMKAVYITYSYGTDAVTINNATMTGTGSLQ